MGVFSRSWRIAGECLRLLDEDKSLLVFPIFSTISLVVLLVSFGVPIWIGAHAAGFVGRQFGLGSASHLLIYLAFYLVNYSITTFFNTALIFVALKRMNGSSATVGDGLRAALARLDKILGYCLIAATIGAILRLIEERVGFIGKIIVGVFGFGFTIATTLAVPVMVAEDVGPIDAIKESIEMMKRTWGENIIGNAGVSAVAALAMFAVIIATVVLCILAAGANMVALAFVIGALGVVAFFGVLLVATTLHSIYTAALYRFASGAQSGPHFDQSLLGNAYRVR